MLGVHGPGSFTGKVSQLTGSAAIALANAVGLHRTIERSVYGPSEGLSTVVLERLAAGGQAGARLSVLTLEDGGTVVGKCLLIATGAQHQRLAAEECELFEGRGVYYAATMNEVDVCQGQEVVVVVVANSAGRAIVFLATRVRRVDVVLRGDSWVHHRACVT